MGTGTLAATLKILVDAETRKATTDLIKLDRKLTAFDKTTATATTRTSSLGKATRSTGARLRSAAGYAAGAAAAYLSISQAKAAVTTTQDLAKATLGLSKNLGLSGREAGEWAAAASSRGVETTKLGMAFKTLATQVETARGGSTEAIEMFEALGISMADLDKGSRDVQGLMLQIADGMDEAGAGTVRMATASKLFGRGFAGIAPLIRDGSDALEENLRATEKVGAALHGEVLADQEKLRALLIESKTAWLGLQVTFTQAITPALGVMNRQFQHLAEIMADDRLTNAEKFKQVGAIIEKWADKALDAFIKVLPMIISRVGEAAPKIAGAFVEGFMKAPILGQFLLGGWLVKRLFGAAMLSTLATRGAGAGTTAGKGFMSGFIGRVAGPAGIAAIIVNEIEDDAGLKKLQETGKAAFASAAQKGLQTGLLDEYIKKLKEAGVTFDKALIQQWVKSGKISAEEGGEMLRTLKSVEAEAAAIRAAEAQRKGFGFAATLARDGKLMKPELKGIIDTLSVMPKKTRDIAAASMIEMARKLQQAGSLPKGSVKQLVDDLEKRFGQIPKDADAAGAKTVKSIDTRMGKAAQKGADHFNSLAAGVHTAVQNIGDNVGKAMKSFNVKWHGFQLAPPRPAGTGGGPAIGAQRGAIVHAQAGATLVPGTGSGDKVRAMLEPGEVVINKKAVAAMGGAKKANAINQAIPRFAEGGVIQHFQQGGKAKGGGGRTAMDVMISRANAWESANEPYLLGGGHGGWVSPGVPIDCSGAVSDVLHAAGLLEGAPMVSGDLMSWGQPASGNEPLVVYANPHHTVMSLMGKAFGTSGSNEGGGAGWIEGSSGQSLAPGAMRTMDVKGVAGAIIGGFEKIKRQVLEGPAGPLLDMGQAAIDQTTRAANKFLASKAPAAPTGTLGGGDAEFVPGDAGGGSVVSQMGHILTANKFGRAGASGIIGNAYRESLWNPASVGSGGGGLFGFTSGAVSLASLQAYAKKQGKPWTDVATQMEFMLSGAASGGLLTYGSLSSFLRSTDDIDAATSRFMLEWERPAAATAALDIRQAAAHRAFEMGSWQEGGIIEKLAQGGQAGKAEDAWGPARVAKEIISNFGGPWPSHAKAQIKAWNRLPKWVRTKFDDDFDPLLSDELFKFMDNGKIALAGTNAPLGELDQIPAKLAQGGHAGIDPWANDDGSVEAFNRAWAIEQRIWGKMDRYTGKPGGFSSAAVAGTANKAENRENAERLLQVMQPVADEYEVWAWNNELSRKARVANKDELRDILGDKWRVTANGFIDYREKQMKGGGVVLSGDSLSVGMNQSAGFPGEWFVDAVGDRDSATGAAKVPALLDKYDPAALVFEHGSNDGGSSMIGGALGKVKQALGDETGLALMNTTNNPAANKVIEDFNRMDALADWNAIASDYGTDLHPPPEGYRAMQEIVKDAAKKAKKVRESSGGGGGGGGGGGQGSGGHTQAPSDNEPDEPSDGTVGGILTLRDAYDAIDKTQNVNHLTKITDAYIRRQAKVLGVARWFDPEAGEMMGALQKLRDEADLYGTFAGNAAQMEDFGDKFQGKSEMEWTQLQLESLFYLRNRLIIAADIIKQRKEIAAKTLKTANTHLKKFAKQVADFDTDQGGEGKTPEDWKGVNPATDEPGAWNKLEDAKRKELKHKWKKAGGELPGDRKFGPDATLLTAATDPEAFPNVDKQKQKIAFLNAAIPALTGHRDTAEATMAALIGPDSFLESVQGPGVSMEVLGTLPEIGILGGEIFDAQLALKGTGTASDMTAEQQDEQISYLQQMLRDANARLRVSQSQYDVFSQTPVLGAFAEGGPIQRSGAYLVGERGPEVVHLQAGGAVSSNADSQAMLAPAAPPEVTINIAPGMEWLKQFISVETQKTTRKQAKGRPLGGARGF